MRRRALPGFGFIEGQSWNKSLYLNDPLTAGLGGIHPDIWNVVIKSGNWNSAGLKEGSANPVFSCMDDNFSASEKSGEAAWLLDHPVVLQSDWEVTWRYRMDDCVCCQTYSFTARSPGACRFGSIIYSLSYDPSFIMSTPAELHRCTLYSPSPQDPAVKPTPSHTRMPATTISIHISLRLLPPNTPPKRERLNHKALFTALLINIHWSLLENKF